MNHGCLVIYYQKNCFTNTSILLCSDWNAVQDFYLDTYNILSYRNLNCRKKIEKIVETF